MDEFFGYHRRLNRRPRLENVQEYGNSWEAWHEELKAEEGYRGMVKGGGNGIFLLPLSLRWWADATDELEEGGPKVWSNNQLRLAMRDLDKSMAGILKSSSLEKAMHGSEIEEEDSDLEIQPKKP